MSEAASQNSALAIIKQAFDSAVRGELGYPELAMIGKVLSDAGNFEMATYLYRTWLSNTKSPMAYVVHADLGDVLIKASDFAGAKDAFKSSLGLNGAYERARVSLAKLPG